MHKILENKTALITGANQGLGLEIAKKYIGAGANLSLCARNERLLDEAYKTLDQLKVNSDQKIVTFSCDVSSLTDVKKFVHGSISALGDCHILVNNAGIYGPKGHIEDNDWDEWKKTIEINLYGSILMLREITPYFKKQKYGKIIQLSGGGATNPLPFLSAYAVSKAGIVRFIETLAEEVREFGIDVNAIAPGALNTKMLDEILAAGPEKVGKTFYDRAVKQKKDGGAPVELGADLALFLASSSSNGITAKLISAVWDNWKEWPNHIADLNSNDVYTLRRIVGRDRGFSWGDK